MNIQQVEYVIAVGELKSFGQAAEKCHITQSTLSTMVGRFEEEIGVTIFDRKTKPISITQEGHEIIRQLRIISREIDTLQEVVQSLKGELAGSLSIGVIPTVAPYLLPLFVQDLVQHLPKVKVVISEMTTEKIIGKLLTRELDIGILSTPINHPDLVETELYEEPFYLYDQAGGLHEGTYAVGEIDLARLWLLEEGHCMRTQAVKICDLSKQKLPEANLEYRSGTIDTLMKFVRRNRGTTLLPYLATLDLPEGERNYIRPFQAPVPARTIGLITHRHFVKRVMLDRLRQEIMNHVGPLIAELPSEREVIEPI
ncbi:LysR substrate-binding domain-containing protein [Pontibacter sp. G13]|uniref:hydrogen peroxide-inducible genes activator n=1 Tax=Pontibacter sp. G13 TaxID=3074898 RepID=UPI00288B8C0A|nr:LysR substrate-binding domain-containing protein [Pontibacter sp. G13]WNJ16438.1 LysR substrate-binding domain-containing protein [Pontibacter sp. G13]